MRPALMGVATRLRSGALPEVSEYHALLIALGFIHPQCAVSRKEEGRGYVNVQIRFERWE
jgi:hypothetical protein